MFHKIMAVTDAGTDLTDYPALARLISDRVDPVSDIHFMQGPVDILDHSSSKYAYGSKIGIDATSKLPNERDLNGNTCNSSEPFGDLREAFPEITSVRSDLPDQGISLLIISLKKSKKNHARHLAADILGLEQPPRVKFILFIPPH